MESFFHGAWFEITPGHQLPISLLQAGNLQVAIHGRDHNVMGPGWGPHGLAKGGLEHNLQESGTYSGTVTGILHKVMTRA